MGNKMETPLHKAAESGDIQAVRDLIISGEKIDDRNRAGETPLHYAARFGNMEVLKLLIENAAKIDEVAENGSTPLHIAIKERQFEIMKIIIENGADVNAESWGRNALDLALEYGYEHTLEIVKLLISKGSKIHHYNIFQAIDSMAIIQYLAQNGANINATCFWSNFQPHKEYSIGCKPLHVAALLGKYEIVKYLVENGADVNARNSKDITPLLSSLQDTYDQLIRDKGYAEIKNRQKIAIYLIEKGAIVSVFDKKTTKTPLHYTVKNGYEDLVKILVNKGENVNARDSFEQTPLMILARFAKDSFEAIADTLLKNGAEINAQEKLGYTPLLLGIKSKHEAFVRYILKEGADLSIKTWKKDKHESKTALQTAELFCDGTLLRFIREKVKELEEENYVIANTVENETSKDQDNTVIEIISESNPVTLPKIYSHIFVCRYCKKIFEKHIYLLSHLRAKKCQTQIKRMKRNSEIEEIKIDTIEDALAISKKEFLGPKPAKIQKVDLAKVENEVQKLKRYQCQKCPQTFANQDSFTNHILFHHSRIDCNICEKYFVGGSAFRKHFSDAHLKNFEL